MVPAECVGAVSSVNVSIVVIGSHHSRHVESKLYNH